jgi:hypothetical protein
VGLVGLGLLLRYIPGALAWFGHLPGDLRFEGEQSTVFIPITSMLVISVVASVILSVLAKLLR